MFMKMYDEKERKKKMQKPINQIKSNLDYIILK